MTAPTAAAPTPEPALDDERSADRLIPEPSRRFVAVVLGLLAVQFLALGLWQAVADSPTNDEGLAIASGVTTLTKQEFRINNEHGAPLSRVLAALPALAAGPVVPDGPAWEAADGTVFPSAVYANRFLQAQDRAGKLGEVVFLARLVPLLEGLAVGLLLFVLGARLFGRAAGLLAAGVWLTVPYVVGLSHLDALDVPSTLATVVACLALERFARAPDWRWAAIVGLTGGVAMLFRTTGIALAVALAIGVVIAARRLSWRAVAMGALVLVTAWASVWVGLRAVAPTSTDTPLTPGLDRGVAATVLEAIPWPSEYRYSIDFAFQQTLERRADRDFEDFAQIETTSYLLGASWDGARWWFWPASMLVKLPPAALLFLVAGLVSWVWLDRRRRARAALVLVLPAALLALTIAQSPLTLGLRYFMPVIALLLVAAGPVVYLAWRAVAGRVVLGVALASQLVFLWASVPHSLAWTAPPFRPGYRSVTDSNLDWGQDMYRLEDWLDGRSVTLDYFGFPGIDRLDDAQLLIDTKPRDIRGWVAVSASLLTSYRRTQYSWLRGYCPVGDIGGTILLYRFDRAPDPRPGPDTPASPCDGEEFSRRVD